MPMRRPRTFHGDSDDIGLNSLSVHSPDTHPIIDTMPSSDMLWNESATVVPPTSSTHFVAPRPPVAFLTCSLTALSLSSSTTSAPAALIARDFASLRVVEMTVGLTSGAKSMDLASAAHASPTEVVPPRMRSVSVGCSLSDSASVPQAATEVREGYGPLDDSCT